MNTSTVQLAASTESQQLIVVSFLLFIVITLFLSVFFGLESEEPAEFYIGKERFSPFVSGLTIAGSFVSTALLLSVTGAVATAGLDGMTMAVGVLLSLGLLAALAGPIRSSGAETLGDLFAIRGSGKNPRIAAAVTTLATTGPFLVAQLIGAGSVTADVLGLDSLGAQRLCTIIIGGLVVTCGVLSGARGLTAVQILAAGVTLTAMLAASFAVISVFEGDFASLLSKADDNSTRPGNYLSSGGLLGTGGWARFDFIGVMLALVLGSACMPHVLSRVHAAKDPADARRSVKYAASLVALLCSSVIVLGIGSAALVGAHEIESGRPNADNALMLLARDLGSFVESPIGSIIFSGVACSVFLSVLSVVGGNAIAAAGAVAKDLYRHVGRNSNPSREVKVARFVVFVYGTVGILLAVVAQGYTAGFLAQLTTAVAASAVAPTLLYTFYWSEYNTVGLLWTVYGGTALTIALYTFSPAVSGGPSAFFPESDFVWFNHSNPTFISIPAAFLLGWAGTKLTQDRSKQKTNRDRHALHAADQVGHGSVHQGQSGNH
ncbi:sodium:solute symporter family transporter [Streptomyces tendae]